jgi:hypothetical protein
MKQLMKIGQHLGLLTDHLIARRIHKRTTAEFLLPTCVGFML